MHGERTMTGMGQGICKALSDRAGKGVTVLVFTSAIKILKSLFLFSLVKKIPSGVCD